ncbi:hypothetical protein ACLBWJ_13070 [Microbacterium sp. M4A5_1d]
MADDSFDALIRDLSGVADLVPNKARQAVQQTLMRTRDQWRKAAAGNPLGRQYTAAIDYKIASTAGVMGAGAGGAATIEGEVGPNLERYGGKTGRGGLVPSAGIFDDPLSSVSRAPDRARRKAEEFAGEELTTGLEIAVEQSLNERNL